MKRPRPRFSVRRLLMAIALFAGSLMAIRPLAGIGKMYEEQATLFVFAPPDWVRSDAPRPKLTDEHLCEHARRLVAPEVLDEAAALLNDELGGRNDEPEDPFQLSHPARPHERVPEDLSNPAMPDPGLTDRPTNPPHWVPARTYTRSDLAGRLRTRIVRPPAREPPGHLDWDAIVLSASSHSQGEAKAFALTVVAAYYKRVGLTYASPAGGEGFTVRPPSLDRPWKVALATTLAAIISALPLFLPGGRRPDREGATPV